MENPKIRFKGYTKDWEQRKFSELYARSSEKNDGSIGMDKNITVATMQFKNDVKVSTTEYLKTYYTFKLGDIAFEGHQSKEFRYGRFVENDIGNGIVSHIFAVFRPIQEYDLYFWKYAINNETLMQRILARSTKASTMMHDLVTNDFLNETFLVPSVKEQKQIGAFLNKLDNLITLHQRKCEQTKKLKKYMLQKMFPQNGAKVPEIRFDGFTYDWEQRKFSEFVENVAVRNREGLELECYAVTNDRGFISQKEAHDDFGYMADVDKTAYNIVPPNSFAYNPARINVGSIGYYAGTENVIVSSLYEVFQTADYVEDGFLWHWFKSTHFPKWIERLQEGSVRLYFYYDKLIQCEMKMPSLEEQKKIGKYFDNLDHLITLHQRQHKLHLNMLL
ncbi:MAG: restriction endonuclease subunit S [Agathobacter rectalis]